MNPLYSHRPSIIRRLPGVALCLMASMCLASAIAQDKPASSPVPAPVDIDKPDTQQYKDAAKLAREAGALLAEYAKSKKPSDALKKKIWDLRGKTVVVDGGFVSDGDPTIMVEGDVDYL